MPQAPDTEAPPLPADVRRQQQGPPLAQFAQGAAAAGQPDAGAAKQAVQQWLSQTADLMSKIAKVLQVAQPELMPIIVRMAGAGKLLEQEFNKASQGQGAPMQPGSEPTPQAPEGQQAAMGM